MRLSNRIKSVLPESLQNRIDLGRCRKELRELSKKKPPNTVQAHQSGEMHEYISEGHSLHCWHGTLITERYRLRTDQLSVPMPDINDSKMYERVDFDVDPREPRFLSPLGVITVIATIREAERHNREAWTFRISLITGLTGLGGVLFGVLTALGWTR
ncbi:hypothetical protein IZT72_07685 [Pseudomonas brenneri]|uniref:hypothetical protein n=1 Tax=Pseudomonas brenneri TaxID=129817 RepID=UPI0018A2C188|nr:hypothetical protein [Pseudomonas brenneri]MBF8004478.1 hypothetical protein [Pseudomonas brenneri]